jgi:hypothetical protein
MRSYNELGLALAACFSFMAKIISDSFSSFSRKPALAVAMKLRLWLFE